MPIFLEGAKAGKDQVRRSAMLIRRAVSWALSVKDPDAFVTKVLIIVPAAKLAPASSARPSDLDEEKDEAGTKVTVQIVPTP